MIKEYFIELKTLNRSHNLFLPFLLLVISIPLPVFINNLFIFLLTVIVLIGVTKKQVKYNLVWSLLIIFFLLCCLSISWSIDFKSSLNTIPRLIPMLVVPFAFMISKSFETNHKTAILKYYSYAMLLLTITFLLRAVLRYFITNDFRVFFFHGENEIDYGLVPKLLNAVHVSVFVVIGYFFFLSKEIKTRKDYLAISLLLGFIILLSCKSIILIVILSSVIHYLYFSKLSHKLRMKNLIVFWFLIILAFSYSKIKDRFEFEFQTNTNTSLSANVIEGIPNKVHYVSIKEAWTNQMFTANDYFNGTAFRVYQFRIFTELVNENNMFFTGFGLNASYPKIKEKAFHYNLYTGEKNVSDSGYQSMNFHNQFIQSFADLGVFGFLLMISMIFISAKNAIRSKDFMHFAFSILMISLFLTESFLLRQRGVVFFTMMYCLFNSGITQNSSKSE